MHLLNSLIKRASSHKTEIFLFAAAFFLFFWKLGASHIWDNSEAEYANVAREVLNGHFWTLFYNGTQYFTHPPLYYWLSALSYQFFGISEWSARFVSALFGFGSVVLTYLTAKKLFDQKIAIASSWIYITMFYPYAIGRIAGLDTLLLFFLMLTLYFYLLFRESQKLSHLVYFYGSLILATYAKGPYAFLQIGMVVVFSLIWESFKKPKPFKYFLEQILKFKLGWFFIIVLPLAISWYVHQSFLYGERFIAQVLGYFGLNRIFGVVQNQTGPIYYYVFVVLLFAFPWTFILPNALNKLRKRADQNFSWRFVTISILSTFIFFSLAGTKLPNYILLIFPFLAMNIALAWQELKKISWTEYILLVLQCVVLIYGFWLLMMERQNVLSPQVITLVKIFLLILLVMSLVIIFYFRFGRNQQNKNQFYLISALGICFLMGVFTFILPATNALKHSRSTMLWLKPLVAKGDVVFEADPTPSFIFYLNHSLQRYAEAKTIDQALKGSQRVFVIFRDNHFQDRYQKALKSKYYVLKQEDMITIISNRNNG